MRKLNSIYNILIAIGNCVENIFGVLMEARRELGKNLIKAHETRTNKTLVTNVYIIMLCILLFSTKCGKEMRN